MKELIKERVNAAQTQTFNTFQAKIKKKKKEKKIQAKKI